MRGMTESDLLRALSKALLIVADQMQVPTPTPAKEHEPKYMRVRDFARSRGYSESTIRSWVRVGMPHVPSGRGSRILVAGADEWISAGGARLAIERRAVAETRKAS